MTSPASGWCNHFVQEMPIRVSALRTLGAYANVFASESFMDELASAAGADPVAFRLAHLKDPRARAVIEAVAAKANWKEGQKGDGTRGRGIAFSKYKNLACYVAVIADIEVDRASGVVRVPRAYAAIDAGLIINPDGLINQTEGGIIQSASWTLKEQVLFDRDGITSRDWASYPIMTMPEVPKVEIALINRPNERPMGAGEGSQGPAVGGDRQCLCPRHGQAHPRSADESATRQSRACVDEQNLTIGLAGGAPEGPPPAGRWQMFDHGE